MDRADVRAAVPGSRTATVRTLAAVGLVTFSFMFVLVVLDALGRSGPLPHLEAPGSAAARLGADHPGEAVHLAGALAGLAIGASGLVGLLVRPRAPGFAVQTGGVALGSIVAILVMGDPDNHGGQAGPVDLVFLLFALPVAAAALAAVPWRDRDRDRGRGRARRTPLVLLATLGLPTAVFGLQQALLQRTTWPPLADPHHQSHWYVMAVLGLVAVPVVAGAAAAGQGWQLGPTAVGLSAGAVAVASLLEPAAASALHPGWAVAALAWGLALLHVTWAPRTRHTCRPAVAGPLTEKELA
jgi:hypothetical protein